MANGFSLQNDLRGAKLVIKDKHRGGFIYAKILS